jgi:tRNA(Arg) A34 adenosine deaminase TadA
MWSEAETTMQFPAFRIALPSWVEPFLATQPDVFPTPETRMALAIELSRLNVLHASGGPFGAALFDDAGRLVAPGMNLVVNAGCSLLHAETVALAFAQQSLGRYDLGGGGERYFELYASTEPCVMCYGAIHWSGVRRLICGARGEDARAIGFDEGEKPVGWAAALEARGIGVVRDLLRQDAVAVLHDYTANGGVVYNPVRLAGVCP